MSGFITKEDEEKDHGGQLAASANWRNGVWGLSINSITHIVSFL